MSRHGVSVALIPSLTQVAGRAAAPAASTWERLSRGQPNPGRFDPVMAAGLPEPACRWLTHAIVPRHPARPSGHRRDGRPHSPWALAAFPGRPAPRPTRWLRVGSASPPRPPKDQWVRPLRRRHRRDALAAARPHPVVNATGPDLDRSAAGRVALDAMLVPTAFLNPLVNWSDGPRPNSDILPGRGQVMDIARQHIRDPQRDPRRVKQRLDIPAEIMSLPRVPQIDDLALAADGFLPAPVRVHDLAVQDQVRHPLGQGPLQRLLQTRRGPRPPRSPHRDTGMPWTAAARSRRQAAGYRRCPGTRPARTALAGNSPACGFPSASRSRSGARPAAQKRTGSAPWARRA